MNHTPVRSLPSYKEDASWTGDGLFGEGWNNRVLSMSFCSLETLAHLGK